MSVPPGTEMFQFPGFASHHYVFMMGSPCGGVAPFGHPRIKACSRLPMAFRSVPRPSSPPDAKASTECSYRARDHGKMSSHPSPNSPCTEANHSPAHSTGRGRSLKHNHSHTQHFTNASERMMPRSRSRAHCCTQTSGQTWLTAARPETHQNLIHSTKERSTRLAPNGNSRPPPRYGERYAAPMGRLLRGCPKSVQGMPDGINQKQARYDTCRPHS